MEIWARGARDDHDACIDVGMTNGYVGSNLHLHVRCLRSKHLPYKQAFMRLASNTPCSSPPPHVCAVPSGLMHRGSYFNPPTPTPAPFQVFLGFGRVFSGVASPGQRVHVLSGAYNPAAPDAHRQTAVLGGVYMMMGRALERVEQVRRAVGGDGASRVEEGRVEGCGVGACVGRRAALRSTLYGPGAEGLTRRRRRRGLRLRASSSGVVGAGGGAMWGWVGHVCSRVGSLRTAGLQAPHTSTAVQPALPPSLPLPHRCHIPFIQPTHPLGSYKYSYSTSSWRHV
jgi:hypothetical protein